MSPQGPAVSGSLALRFGIAGLYHFTWFCVSFRDPNSSVHDWVVSTSFTKPYPNPASLVLLLTLFSLMLLIITGTISFNKSLSVEEQTVRFIPTTPHALKHPLPAMSSEHI